MDALSEPLLEKVDIPAAPELRGPRLHLKYVDGIRGLAALYVVLYHTFQFVVFSPSIQIPRFVKGLLSVFQFGRFPVVVFIVLSGYCLMLPVARSGSKPMPLKDFFRRRSLRILPSYYAALVLSVGLVCLIPSLQTQSHTVWDLARPALGVRTLLAHVLLVHNFFPSFELKIDPPLWSIAVEWQIYFVFALVLLPIWRTKGLTWCVLTAIALGVAPAYLGVSVAFTWFLVLFAFGIAAAVLGFDPRAAHLPVLRLRWYWWSAALFIAMVVVAVVLKSWQERLFPGLDLTVRLTTDLLGGLSATAFILGATACLQAGRPLTGIAKLMASRGPVAIGAFSYSLYLIHYPILAAVATTLIARHYGATFDVILMLSTVPLVCMAAFGFYWLFERPFLNRRSEKVA